MLLDHSEPPRFLREEDFADLKPRRGGPSLPVSESRKQTFLEVVIHPRAMPVPWQSGWRPSLRQLSRRNLRRCLSLYVGKRTKPSPQELGEACTCHLEDSLRQMHPARRTAQT